MVFSTKRFAIVALFAPTFATAQTLASSRVGSAPPKETRGTTATVALATRALKSPVIDGKADDAVWATAQVIDGFRTFDPIDNGDPRFRTEARVAYDEHNLYVLVRAFDPHPDSIVALLSRRDVRAAHPLNVFLIKGSYWLSY
jgi:hypothetical protein